MRKAFLIIGAVLAVVVAAGIFLFLQSTRPTVVEVPLAISDIPAGTVLKADHFRLTRMANVDTQTLSKWVTLSTWKQAEGKATTSDIRAGFPIAWSQIDPTSTSNFEARLSLALTGTNELYVVIPAAPDEIGNFVQPGDRIDLIIAIGSADRRETLELGTTVTDTAGALPQPQLEPGTVITQIIQSPVSKLVMQNMTVLRVDRERARTTTASSSQNQQQQQTTEAPPTNDVKRLYVKVNADQLEVLSFVLNNGKHNFAVRAANGSQATLPTDGVTWDDFVRWFYAQRGDRFDGAQPFNAVSPRGEGEAQ